MGSSTARRDAVHAITNFKPVAAGINYKATPVKEIFASDVFNE